MTEPYFQAVVRLAGVKPNKVRAYLCGRTVGACHRRKICRALDTLGRQTRGAQRAAA